MGPRDRISSFLRQADIESEPTGFDYDSDSSESAIDKTIQKALGITDQVELDIVYPEEAISDMYQELPGRLGQLGLADPGSIEIDNIEILMTEGFDVEDVENLYFHIWDEVSKEHGYFSRVTFEYIMEEAEVEDPSELKVSQDNEAFITLKSVGIDEDELLDIRSSTDSKKRHIRRLGWLLTQERSLEELRKGLTRATKSSPDTKIGLSELANHVYSVVYDTRERTRSIDPRVLTKRKQKIRSAEIRRLGYIQNIAASVADGLNHKDQMLQK